MAENPVDLKTSEEQDFPVEAKEAVSTLPFFIGGTKQLATTDVQEVLLWRGELKRAEQLVAYAIGTHTGSNNAAVLTDSAGDFLNKGVQIGDKIYNTPDGS